MDIIEEFDHAGCTVKIYPDENPDSPREWDNLGTLVCWHPRYNLGDENISRDKAQEAIDAIPARSVVLPVYLYDHSGLRVNTTGFSCPWDSGQVGFIYITPEKIRHEYGWARVTQLRRDKIRAYLRNEIETLDQYLCGDVFGFVVEDSDGNHLDSCWGFYGLEYCKQEAREAAEACRPEPEPDPQLTFAFA